MNVSEVAVLGADKAGLMAAPPLKCTAPRRAGRFVPGNNLAGSGVGKVANAAWTGDEAGLMWNAGNGTTDRETKLT